MKQMYWMCSQRTRYTSKWHCMQKGNQHKIQINVMTDPLPVARVQPYEIRSKLIKTILAFPNVRRAWPQLIATSCGESVRSAVTVMLVVKVVNRFKFVNIHWNCDAENWRFSYSGSHRPPLKLNVTKFLMKETNKNCIPWTSLPFHWYSNTNQTWSPFWC